MIITKWSCFFLFITAVAFSSVWEVEQHWDQNWEKQYSSWVEKNWQQDIFTNESSLLYNLKTDCADASYAMRATFSYLHKLPFQFTSSSGRKINQASIVFDQVGNKDQRFRLFLEYVFTNTNTQTLSVDTYPVAISRETLRPGMLYVAPGIHSYQVIKLDIYGNIQTLSSTVPKAVRVLFLNHSFPFYLPSDFHKFSDGFRAFRWPEGLNPNESKDQFDISRQAQGSFIVYSNQLIFRLSLKSEPLEFKIKRHLESLCYYARERSVLVAQAYVKKLARKGSCLDRSQFEDYSTYQRDSRLKEYFNYLQSLKSDLDWQTLPEELKARYLSLFNNYYQDSFCQIETSWPGKPLLSLYEIRQALVAGKLVANPNADIEQRWGLKEFTAKNSCYTSN